MSWKPWVLAAVLLSAAIEVDADPFEDFRIPDHTSSGLAVSGSGSLKRDRTGDGSLTQSFSNADASLYGRGYWKRNGEALQLSLDAAARVLGSRFDSRQRHEFLLPYLISTQQAHVRNKGLSEAWTLLASARRYPWALPIGETVSLTAIGHYTQSWQVARSEGVNRDALQDIREVSGQGAETWYYDYQLGITAGVGLGRVRDANGVLDAYVLEHRLLESGVLTRPLSPQTLQKLAELAYVAPEYQAAHDRPDRYIWRDLERILREDGALGPAGLDAWSVLRGRESYRLLPPGSGSSLRATGYFVGPAISAYHESTIVRDDETHDDAFYQADTLVSASTLASGFRATRWSDLISLGGEAEFHRPLDWRWQIDAGGHVLTPVIHARRGLDALLEADVDYLIADRWEAAAFASYQRSYFVPDDGSLASLGQDLWQSQAGVSLAWYVEDRTLVSLTATETESRGGAPLQSSLLRARRNGGSIQLGISYRISGRLAAPGLIDPLTLGR